MQFHIGVRKPIMVHWFEALEKEREQKSNSKRGRPRNYQPLCNSVSGVSAWFRLSKTNLSTPVYTVHPCLSNDYTAFPKSQAVIEPRGINDRSEDHRIYLRKGGGEREGRDRQIPHLKMHFLNWDPHWNLDMEGTQSFHLFLPHTLGLQLMGWKLFFKYPGTQKTSPIISKKYYIFLPCHLSGFIIPVFKKLWRQTEGTSIRKCMILLSVGCASKCPINWRGLSLLSVRCTLMCIKTEMWSHLFPWEVDLDALC